MMARVEKAGEGQCKYKLLDGKFCGLDIEKRKEFQDRNGNEYCLFHSRNDVKNDEFYKTIRHYIEQCNQAFINAFNSLGDSITGEEREERIDELREKHRIDFEGFYFPPDADFRGTEFKTNVVMLKTEFGGEAYFPGAEFGGSADFSYAKFEKDADFRVKKLDRAAVFAGTGFGGAAVFAEVEFSEAATFYGAEFGGVANFWNAKFEKDVHFLMTKFGAEVKFSNAEFVDVADFSNAKFEKAADFRVNKFGGEVKFHNAEFADVADFSNAKFEKDAAFRVKRFGGAANFYKSDFIGKATFSNAKFEKDADFRVKKFGGVVSYAEADFSVAADFSNAKFEKDGDFRVKKFGGLVNFSNAEFDGMANFQNAEFGGDADFREALFDGKVDFSLVQFKRKASFLVKKFNHETIFTRSRFFRDVSFFGVEFNGKSYFSRVEFDRAADFRETKFKNDSYFNNDEFTRNADFTNSIFKGKISFDHIHFNTRADFNGAAFLSESVDFSDTSFPIDKTFFHRAIFNCEARFHRTVFKGVRFTNCYIGSCSFLGSDVRDAVFINSTWDRSFLEKQIEDFKKQRKPEFPVEPFKLPNLLRLKLRKSVLFDEIEYIKGKKKSRLEEMILYIFLLFKYLFKGMPKNEEEARVLARQIHTKRPIKETGEDGKGKTEDEKEKSELDTFYLESLYCQFKLNMDQNKSFVQANDFYFGEKLMERKNLWREAKKRWKNPFLWLKWLFLLLYWFLSGYGNRPIRAVLNFIGIISLASLLLVCTNAVQPINKNPDVYRYQNLMTSANASDRDADISPEASAIKLLKIFFNILRLPAPYFPAAIEWNTFAGELVITKAKKEASTELKKDFCDSLYYVTMWNITATPALQSGDYKVRDSIFAHFCIFLIQWIYRPLMITLIIISVRRKIKRG